MFPHLQTGALLDVTLGAGRAAVDVVGAADGVRLRAAGVAARLQLTAGGRRRAARLAVRTHVRGGGGGGGGGGGAGQRHGVAAARPAPGQQVESLQSVWGAATAHAVHQVTLKALRTAVQLVGAADAARERTAAIRLVRLDGHAAGAAPAAGAVRADLGQDRHRRGRQQQYHGKAAHRQAARRCSVRSGAAAGWRAVLADCADGALTTDPSAASDEPTSNGLQHVVLLRNTGFSALCHVSSMLLVVIVRRHYGRRRPTAAAFSRPLSPEIRRVAADFIRSLTKAVMARLAS